MTIINKITNNDWFYPEEITDKFCNYLKQNDIVVYNDDELQTALYHLKAVCENPYNSEYFRVFYDVLSSIAETITISE